MHPISDINTEQFLIDVRQKIENNKSFFNAYATGKIPKNDANKRKILEILKINSFNDLLSNDMVQEKFKKMMLLNNEVEKEKKGALLHEDSDAKKLAIRGAMLKECSNYDSVGLPGFNIGTACKAAVMLAYLIM